MKARKKTRVRLPWDVSNMFPEAIPEGDSDDDEEAVEANVADLQRLKVCFLKTFDGRMKMNAQGQ
jgi:hypothetical protein